MAARHLVASGYRILARNWRVRRYELDIVAEKDGIVVFVEVKTRSRGPQEAVESLTFAQRRRIRRAAESWIHASPGVGVEFRFDLISIDVGSRGTSVLRHVEHAFHGDDAR